MIARLRAHVRDAEPIDLDAGYVWLPWRAKKVITLDDDSARRHEHLGPVLVGWLASVSGADGIAFVETRFFGGSGGQVGSAWRDGALVVDAGSVNDALRAIGVRAIPGRDEWRTVGLERHRKMPGD